MKRLIKAFFVILRNIRHILRKNKADNVPAISGYSALFIILSFVPFIMFIIAILSIFNNGSTAFLKSFETEAGSQLDFMPFLKNIVEEALKSASGVAVVTGIISLWSAGKGLYSVTDGISRIYRIDDSRPWIARRFFSMGYTIFMLLVILVAYAGFVVLRFVEGFITPYVSKLPYALGVLFALRNVLLVVLSAILIAFALKLYLRRRVADKRFSKFRVQLPGAVFIALAWELFSFGIEIFIKSFNGFNVYGSLASVAGFMFWTYYMMYIFLLGVQINYVYRLKIYIRFTPKMLFKKNRKSLK